MDQITKDLVAAIISKGAGDFEPEDAWYIDGDEDCLTFCWECAKKRLGELLEENQEADEDEQKDPGDIFIDGANDSSSDSFPVCDECSKPLKGHLTDWGINEGINRFTDHTEPPIDPRSCWEMYELLTYEMDQHCRSVAEVEGIVRRMVLLLLTTPPEKRYEKAFEPVFEGVKWIRCDSVTLEPDEANPAPNPGA